MPDINREHIEQLVERPTESLAVELKAWISPNEPAGKAKIIKAAIALRNRNGGYLLIGFDDKTLEQTVNGAPEDVHALFHVDVIQGIVTKYASDTFEIAVEFVERNGITHPVIVVPAGVKTPVAAKGDLKDGEAVQVRIDDVYVRTLSSNNTVSSARPRAKDWAELVEICFDNREADIGRFFRRHLAGANADALREFAAAITDHIQPKETVRERLEMLLDDGLARFRRAVEKRKVTLPSHGSWEAGLIFESGVPTQGNLGEFSRLLNASNPSYTGWPMWLDSVASADQANRPYVSDSGWDALILVLDPNTFRHIDFMRKDPRGVFYSYRSLEDDVTHADRAPTPMTGLDGILPVSRVAEAVAVGLAFANALLAPKASNLEFMFRWTGLSGRELMSWVEPARYISPRTAQQDVVTSTVAVPIDTAPSALFEYVNIAVQPLYEIFDGFEFPKSVVEELVQKMLERRW